ncbi:MAG: hypothetical protein ACFFCQ_05990, partial [Promethearchaeota archaeon]
VELHKTIDELRSRVDYLEKQLTELRTLSHDYIELRVIPISEAKPLILDYIKEHPGCLTSELVLELGLDEVVVLDTLQQLQKEGRIHPRD